MDAKKVFTDFLSDLKSSFPDFKSIGDVDVDKTAAELEVFYPDALEVIQKDSAFFDSPRIVFGINLSTIWETTEDTTAAIWKHLQISMIASFLHGDMKSKMGKIMEIAKTMLGDRGDAVSKIFEDESTEGHFKEIIDFVMQTRIAKLFFSLIEQFDMSEFDFDIENPQQLMEMVQNPENPMIKKMISKVQGLVHDKLQRGEITKDQIVREIEDIKSKVVLTFGDVFNDMLGLGSKKDKGNRPVLNTPQARAQYRRDRLRMKLQEKYKK
jgi:hypothetical protein